ncbi:MAG: hypothetical protein C5S49_03755 [Candidatus Methanogaster sp.]|nr:MAG: hypothetical protein C5S49_03755 [ANME-2 cluster archaeon]
MADLVIPLPFPFPFTFLDPLPLNIRSVSFSARIVLEPDKPSAKMIPSTMFDLPLPFGPDMAVKSLKNGIFAFFPNDLKLSNSISLMCICNQSSDNDDIVLPSASLIRFRGVLRYDVLGMVDFFLFFRIWRAFLRHLVDQ